MNTILHIHGLLDHDHVDPRTPGFFLFLLHERSLLAPAGTIIYAYVAALRDRSAYITFKPLHGNSTAAAALESSALVK